MSLGPYADGPFAAALRLSGKHRVLLFCIADGFFLDAVVGLLGEGGERPILTPLLEYSVL